jgi:hypothetical protein
MTEKEAGPYTRHSVSTLQKRRVYGGGPRYVKRGRSVYYHIEDLDAWMRERVVHSTSERVTA